MTTREQQLLDLLERQHRYRLESLERQRMIRRMNDTYTYAMAFWATTVCATLILSFVIIDKATRTPPPPKPAAVSVNEHASQK
jgi:hypothetical protein